MYTFKTMSGANKQKGTVKLKIKIFNLEKEMLFFVFDKKDFTYDVLIGLDIIRAFGLCQNHNLEISQYIEKNYNKTDNIKINEIKNNNNNTDYPIRDNNIEVNYNEMIPIENFEANLDHLDNDKKREINKIINEFGSIFAKDKYDIGRVQNYEAQIRLSENKYIKKKPYRCSFIDQEEINNQIKALLKK